MSHQDAKSQLSEAHTRLSSVGNELLQAIESLSERTGLVGLQQRKDDDDDDDDDDADSSAADPTPPRSSPAEMPELNPESSRNNSSLDSSMESSHDHATSRDGNPALSMNTQNSSFLLTEAWSQLLENSLTRLCRKTAANHGLLRWVYLSQRTAIRHWGSYLEGRRGLRRDARLGVASWIEVPNPMPNPIGRIRMLIANPIERMGMLIANPVRIRMSIADPLSSF